MAVDPKQIARHPLTITVFSFLLTGVVGAFLSSRLNETQRERDRLLQVTAARQTAVQDFARTTYDRWTRANMLWSALRRAASLDEVRERKRAYDDTYARWGRELQANLFLIRTAMASDEYTEFEGHVEFRLVPILREIDACLTEAYDLRVAGGDARPTLQRCAIDRKMTGALNCAYAITDQLFRVAVPETPRTPLEAREARQAANAEIQARCQGA